MARQNLQHVGKGKQFNNAIYIIEREHQTGGNNASKARQGLKYKRQTKCEQGGGGRNHLRNIRLGQQTGNKVLEVGIILVTFQQINHVIFCKGTGRC